MEKIIATIFLVFIWLVASYYLIEYGFLWLLLKIISWMPEWIIQSRTWDDGLGPLAGFLFVIIPVLVLAIWPFLRLFLWIWDEP